MMFGLFGSMFKRSKEVNRSEELESDGIKVIPYNAWIYQTLSKELESANNIKKGCENECNGACARLSCEGCPNHEELMKAQDQIARCENDINVVLAQSLVA